MLPYIGNIASNCQSKDESFAIECIGTLANLNLPNIDYNLVLNEYNLVPWLKGALGKCYCISYIIFLAHMFHSHIVYVKMMTTI